MICFVYVIACLRYCRAWNICMELNVGVCLYMLYYLQLVYSSFGLFGFYCCCYCVPRWVCFCCLILYILLLMAMYMLIKMKIGLLDKSKQLIGDHWQSTHTGLEMFNDIRSGIWVFLVITPSQWAQHGWLISTAWV